MLQEGGKVGQAWWVIVVNGMIIASEVTDCTKSSVKINNIDTFWSIVTLNLIKHFWKRQFRKYL